MSEIDDNKFWLIFWSLVFGSTILIIGITCFAPESKVQNEDFVAQRIKAIDRVSYLDGVQRAELIKEILKGSTNINQNVDVVLEKK